jgi:hypothetical protein
LAAFSFLYAWFYQVSASPEAPEEADQSVLIFTDRPNVPMQALVSFEDWTTGSGEFNTVYLSLMVDSSYEGNSVGFSVAFGGENFRRPSQELGPKIGDCSLEVEFYGDSVAPSCSDAKNLQGAITSFALKQSQVLSGTMTRADGSGVMHTTLTVSSRSGWTSAGASRTAFALPLVGTGYREPGWSPTEESFGDQRLFDPDMSKLTVSYRNLQSDEKVEIASPAPSRDDQLSWSQEGSNSFAARGSTIVLGMQERQTNVTFIVGVFAGLVPLIVSWVYKQLGQRADPKPKKK